MQLSFRHREHLYADFAMLLKSGMGFVAGLRTLEDTPGPEGRVIAVMLKEPTSAASAFAAARNAWGEFDIRLIEAAERSGRLMEVFQELAAYYGHRYRARRDFIGRMMYPLFVFNLGAVLVPIPLAVQQGFSTFLKMVLLNLGGFYGFALLLVLVWKTIRFLSARQAIGDLWIRRIPIIGRFFADAADGRFSFALHLQIRSGISIYRALEAAAQGSGSAYLRKATQKAAAQIQNGARLWQAFQRTSIHPRLKRALRIGEESGRLDKQLQECALELQEQTTRRVKTFSVWVPTLIYVTILILLGTQIILGFQKVLSGITQTFEL